MKDSCEIINFENNTGLELKSVVFYSCNKIASNLVDDCFDSSIIGIIEKTKLYQIINRIQVLFHDDSTFTKFIKTNKIDTSSKDNGLYKIIKIILDGYEINNNQKVHIIDYLYKYFWENMNLCNAINSKLQLENNNYFVDNYENRKSNFALYIDVFFHFLDNLFSLDGSFVYKDYLINKLKYYFPDDEYINLVNAYYDYMQITNFKGFNGEHGSNLAFLQSIKDTINLGKMSNLTRVITQILMINKLLNESEGGSYTKSYLESVYFEFLQLKISSINSMFSSPLIYTHTIFEQGGMVLELDESKLNIFDDHFGILPAIMLENEVIKSGLISGEEYICQTNLFIPIYPCDKLFIERVDNIVYVKLFFNKSIILAQLSIGTNNIKETHFSQDGLYLKTNLTNNHSQGVLHRADRINAFANNPVSEYKSVQLDIQASIKEYLGFVIYNNLHNPEFLKQLQISFPKIKDKINDLGKLKGQFGKIKVSDLNLQNLSLVNIQLKIKVESINIKSSNQGVLLLMKIDLFTIDNHFVGSYQFSII